MKLTRMSTPSCSAAATSFTASRATGSNCRSIIGRSVLTFANHTNSEARSSARTRGRGGIRRLGSPWEGLGLSPCGACAWMVPPQRSRMEPRLRTQRTRNGHAGTRHVLPSEGAMARDHTQRTANSSLLTPGRRASRFCRQCAGQQGAEQSAPRCALSRHRPCAAFPAVAFPGLAATAAVTRTLRHQRWPSWLLYACAPTSHQHQGGTAVTFEWAPAEPSRATSSITMCSSPIAGGKNLHDTSWLCHEGNCYAI